MSPHTAYLGVIDRTLSRASCWRANFSVFFAAAPVDQGAHRAPRACACAAYLPSPYYWRPFGAQGTPEISIYSL